MKDIEIIIFQDKSWVRLTEYQKAKEECEQLQQKWLESDYEKSKLVSQIEKMKCCKNCRIRGAECVALEHQGILCGKTKNKWELAE